MSSQKSLHHFLSTHCSKNLALKQTLEDIAKAIEEIHGIISRGLLSDSLSQSDQTNVQGEQQYKLDIVADEIFCQRLKNSAVKAIISEEQDGVIPCNADENASLLVAFDPLDGSSNININMPRGEYILYFRG